MSLKRTQAHRGCTRRFAGLSVSHCGLMHSVPYHHAAVIFTCCSVSAEEQQGPFSVAGSFPAEATRVE